MDEKYMTIIDLEIINYTVKIEREEGGGEEIRSMPVIKDEYNQ